MGSVNARTLQDVKNIHGEKRKDDRIGRFIKKRATNGQHIKMFKQVRNPIAHISEEKMYPKFVAQEGDNERYGDLRFDESVFSA